MIDESHNTFSFLLLLRCLFNKSHDDLRLSIRWLETWNMVFFFGEDLLQEPTWMGWVISETCERGGKMWEDGEDVSKKKCVEKNVQTWFFEKNSLLCWSHLEIWDIEFEDENCKLVAFRSGLKW